MNTTRRKPKLESHYLRWRDEDCIERFARKQAGDFFPSELHFLEQIAPNVHTALDIGCASGHFVKMLREIGENIDYTGVDIVPENIARAREFYPDCEFILGNALEVPLKENFDLVNATGVVQHEPRFEDLLRRMWSFSGRYLLFDAKLACIEEHICDLDTAFCQSGGKKLYFIINSLDRLLDFLSGFGGVRSIEAFGYVTEPNDRTAIRGGCGEFVSANFLLERSSTGEDDGVSPKISLSLPIDSAPAH